MPEHIDEAKILAAERGGRCLSKNCSTTKSKIEFECGKGHIWKAIFGNIKYKNQWCKKCIGISQRNTIEDCVMLAKNKNGECISNTYMSNFKKLKWKCKNNHIWSASFNKISQGRWCPYCSKKVKHAIELANDIAISRGGKCLSKEYINLKSKLKWKCARNHIWSAPLNSIKNSNTWCEKCSITSRKKYSTDDLLRHGIKMKGKCLSTKYINYNTKYLWECKNNHTWDATWVNISRGTWCPICRRKSQIILFNLIEEIYPSSKIYSDYRKFAWLKNDHNRGIQAIDIFVSDIKLAIEYDGQGHFYPVNFGGCSDGAALTLFNLTKKRDALKNKKIAKNKQDVEYFIRFDYKEPIDNKSYVISKLIKNNIPVEI